MSIVTLARKTRAQRGASTRRGWTLATTKSGKCAPCSGGAPDKQLSFRQLINKKTECCMNTWKPVADQSTSEYLMKRKLIVEKYDASNNEANSCINPGCGCKCSSRIGEAVCCNVYKNMNTKTIGENLNHMINKRACMSGCPDPTNCPKCVEQRPTNSCICK